MEPLLAMWPEIRDQIKGAKHVLLLSDYDGTLTPIVARPEAATLSDSCRDLLRALSHKTHMTVGIVSGRALSDLTERVGLPGLVYAGNHGLEIKGPGIAFVSPLAEETKPLLRVLHQVLAKTLGSIGGTIVENKGLSLSVHFRSVDEDRQEEVKSTFHRIIGGARHLGMIRVTTGKKVLEVRPPIDWHKGKAIQLLMKRYGKGGRNSGLLPIYLGDDLTDEDGFQFIENYGHGLSILVDEEGKRQTRARHWLRSPQEVERFFRMIVES